MLKTVLRHLITVLGLSMAAGCDSSGADGVTTSLDEPVKLEIAGRHFDVPLRYFFTEGREKRSSWPKPKKERVRTDAITLSVLLPDMRPYYPEDEQKWKLRGHGDRLQLTMSKPVGAADWFPRVRERKLLEVEQGLATRLPDAFGLHAIARGGVTYLPADERQLIISCNAPAPGSSASCLVKSNCQMGVVLEYYYGAPHLERWREIDERTKALCERMEVGRAN